MDGAVGLLGQTSGQPRPFDPISEPPYAPSMADAAPELLHLLKAGRILQYRQQNVALVSAAEGT